MHKERYYSVLSRAELGRLSRSDSQRLVAQASLITYSRPGVSFLGLDLIDGYNLAMNIRRDVGGVGNILCITYTTHVHMMFSQESLSFICSSAFPLIQQAEVTIIRDIPACFPHRPPYVCAYYFSTVLNPRPLASEPPD